MQMEQKESGVRTNRLLKLLIMVLAGIFILNNVYGQTDNYEFQREFIKKFRYPSALRNVCTATFTNILITVSEKGIDATDLDAGGSAGCALR